MSTSKTNTEIVTSEPKKTAIETINPETLILQAIKQNLPVETMERLLAMRTQLKEEYAREQYFSAMSSLQGEMPIIEKSTPGGSTNNGKIAYFYASLEQIISVVKPFIEKYGFSFRIESETLENGVKVSCIVNHIAGHSESTTINVAFGTKTGVMSMPQVQMGAMTFATRYAFRNAFGIVTGDEDTDDQQHAPVIDKPAQKPYTPPVKDVEPVKKETVPLPKADNPTDNEQLKKIFEEILIEINNDSEKKSQLKKSISDCGKEGFSTLALKDALRIHFDFTGREYGK